jgi:hypothetical protein
MILIGMIGGEKMGWREIGMRPKKGRSRGRKATKSFAAFMRGGR